MDEVAARAGVAKGSLYLYANNREGLVGEVLDRWSSEVACDAAAPGDPRVRSRRCMRCLVRGGGVWWPRGRAGVPLQSAQ